MSGLLAPQQILEPVAVERFARRLAAGARSQRILGDPLATGRSYELIWADSHVNAWIIRWSDDADTGFHDHDGSAAGIVVLEGAVVEERLALGAPPLARRFGAGESFHMPASAIHRIRHAGGRSALTVHAYSPPLTVQGVYRECAEGALERYTVPYTEELRGELALAT